MHSYNELLLAYETLLREYIHIKIGILPSHREKKYINKVKSAWLRFAIYQCDKFGINSAEYQDELKKIQEKPKVQEEAE